jgi:tight adherence protein B
VARVRTATVGLIGSCATVWLARRARRYAITDRLTSRERRRWLPAAWHARAAGALDRAAISMPVEQALQLWLAGIAVAALLGAGLAGVSSALPMCVGAVIAGPAFVFARRNRRARVITAAIPVVVDSIAAELRAGGTIATAIRGVAFGDSALSGDFQRIVARVEVGAPLDEALRAWARERPIPGVDSLAGALAVCARTGGPAADALDALSSALRDRLAVIAEAHALSAQARLSARVIGAAPVAYLAWSTLIDPSTLHTLAGTNAGRACVVFGGALECIGLWWMRRIVRAGSVL